MDRRSFLVGLFGVAAVAALPDVVALAEPTSEDWIKAIMEVHRKTLFDLTVFGQCYTQHIETFPYIRHVPLSEVFRD